MPKMKFGDLVYNITEKRSPVPGDEELYIGLEHLDSGSLRVSRWGSKVELKGDKLKMEKGDILFGRRNTYLRRVAIAPHDGLFSAHGMIFRAKTTCMDEDFLPFFLTSDYFMDEAIRISVGSLSPTVNWRELKELEFDIPDIEMQQKLVQPLLAANELKEEYERLLSLTDELVKSQFIEMFGDPIDNPMSWQKQQLQMLTTKDCSISYGIVKTGDDTPGGVPVFRPVDIVGKMPTVSELKRTTVEISNQYKRTLLTGRELLITVRANIADTCIIGEEFTGCNVGRGIVPLRVDESIIRLEFLKSLIDFDSMNEHIKSKAKGTTLIQLNMEDLRIIEFIIPPIAKQDEFIAFTKQSDKSKFELKQNIENINALMKSLMSQDFSS